MFQRKSFTSYAVKFFLLAVALFCAGPGNAQSIPTGSTGAPAPDCYNSGSVSAIGRPYTLNNIGTGCTVWHLFYTAGSSVSALSIEIDQAPRGATDATIGAWAPMSGVAFGSTNPSVVTVAGEIAAAPIVVPAWVSINITTYTGSGNISWVLMGYRPGVSTSPGAGFGVFAITATSSGLPNFVVACDTQVSISATTVATMISGTAAKNIHICSLNIALSGAGTVTITEGTGATCAGAPTTRMAATTFATGTPFTAGSGVGQILFTQTTGDNLCIAASAGTVAGFATYTVY